MPPMDTKSNKTFLVTKLKLSYIYFYTIHEISLMSLRKLAPSALKFNTDPLLGERYIEN